jgi:hypothetical protein
MVGRIWSHFVTAFRQFGPTSIAAKKYVIPVYYYAKH